jgi:hypothetical protein
MKHLTIAIIFAVLVVLGVGEYKGEGISYTTFFQAIQVETPAQAQEAPSFPRGKVVGTDCRPDFNKSAHYESETVGKPELLHRFNALGIPAEYHDTMAAIAMAESIRGQISCHGDDYSPYYMQKAPNGQTWTYSIGLFQIRLIKEQTGTGQCRDETRLKDNVDQQILCAWELSGSGRSWSPWSVTHSNRGKPYLNWLGKNYNAHSWDGNQWIAH